MCYHVGGNTKLYGAALFRFRERDFEKVQHAGGVSRGADRRMGASGSGRATALLLAAEGARVLIFGRHEREMN
jgi:hypothetical protein